MECVCDLSISTRQNALQALLSPQSFADERLTTLTREALARFDAYFNLPISTLNPFRNNFIPSDAETVGRLEDLLNAYARTCVPSARTEVRNDHGLIRLYIQDNRNGMSAVGYGFRVLDGRVEVVNPDNPQQIYGTIPRR